MELAGLLCHLLLKIVCKGFEYFIRVRILFILLFLLLFCSIFIIFLDTLLLICCAICFNHVKGFFWDKFLLFKFLWCTNFWFLRFFEMFSSQVKKVLSQCNSLIHVTFNRIIEKEAKAFDYLHCLRVIFSLQVFLVLYVIFHAL